MQSGRLITLEGIEGVGKTTALQFVNDYLQKQDYTTVTTREPGGTPMAESIRNILLGEYKESMLPQTELLLMFASRAQHVEHCIRPHLQAGHVVIADRFVDASYAYQGGGRQVDTKIIQQLEGFCQQGLAPDLTLLLDAPVEKGLERAKQRQGPYDRIEQETYEFFTKVRQAYLERAEQYPERYVVIDATQTLENVQHDLKQALDELMRSKC